MKLFLPILFLLACYHSFGQAQTCPLNSNFSLGNLTNWSAYTGNNARGNPASEIKPYFSDRGAPDGTQGVNTITEYNLPSVTGIQIITGNSTDYWGGFP